MKRTLSIRETQLTLLACKGGVYAELSVAKFGVFIPWKVTFTLEEATLLSEEIARVISAARSLEGAVA